MPTYRVTALEKHLYEVVYRAVEADSPEEAAERVSECSLDYDSKSIADDPGEFVAVIEVEEVGGE